MPEAVPGTRSLRTLGLLTRGALHEISNPLLGLVGSAELALGDLEPGTKLHERIALTHRTGTEIAGIVRALQGSSGSRAPRLALSRWATRPRARSRSSTSCCRPTTDADRVRRRNRGRLAGRTELLARRAPRRRARAQRLEGHDRARGPGRGKRGDRRGDRRRRAPAAGPTLLAPEPHTLRVVQRLGRDLPADPVAEDLHLDRRSWLRARSGRYAYAIERSTV